MIKLIPFGCRKAIDSSPGIVSVLYFNQASVFIAFLLGVLVLSTWLSHPVINV